MKFQSNVQLSQQNKKTKNVDMFKITIKIWNKKKYKPVSSTVSVGLFKTNRNFKHMRIIQITFGQILYLNTIIKKRNVEGQSNPRPIKSIIQF